MPPAKRTRLLLFVNAVEGMLNDKENEEEDGEEGECYKCVSKDDIRIFFDKIWIHFPA